MAILDADKEGFLRSTRSLIQTIGRAARNVRGKAILYGDTITGSMKDAMDETARRREKQVEYNTLHGITPTTVVRRIADIMEGARADVGSRGKGRKGKEAKKAQEEQADYGSLTPEQVGSTIKKLETRMYKHAQNLEFEEAGKLRDEIHRLRDRALR